jgi:hypothetical protein
MKNKGKTADFKTSEKFKGRHETSIDFKDFRIEMSVISSLMKNLTGNLSVR